MSDSTYADEEGYSESDRVVTDGLFSLIADAPARVIISSFASQIARIQIVADAAEAYNRKLAIVGRSMVETFQHLLVLRGASGDGVCGCHPCVLSVGWLFVSDGC